LAPLWATSCGSSSAAGGSLCCTYFTGLLLCLTIIGIPLGLANFKLINVSMRPFGREIVSADEARHRGMDSVVAF